MSDLFSPCSVGRWSLPHRVVMAPLTRNRAPGALPTALMAQYYAQRADARTGAALIISEATAISHQAQGYSDVPGIWSDAQVAAWQPVTEAVHARGGRIVMQLWHVGRVSHTSLQPQEQAPVAPSALVAKTKTVLVEDGVARFVDTSMPRALQEPEIAAIVADYAHAAANAIRAGFDGVEVHAANGYLIDQFLRDSANERSDGYGGSIENRVRFLAEVMQAVCAAVGGARVGIRISPVTPANDVVDSQPHALFKDVVETLGPLGLAYVHVIEGSTGGPRDYPAGESPFDYAALKQAYRNAGGQGAWMLNNGYDSALAQDAVRSGRGDLIAFGRPFIANPDLSARLRSGAALNSVDRKTLYGGGAAGYTDYPAA